MTDRQTFKETLLKTTGPSYFLVKFHVDNTICVIPSKKMVNPTNLCVDGECQEKWSAKEILKATVVAMGEKTEVENAERELMKDLEEQEPPAKKKDNKKTAPRERKGERKPLTPIQPVSAVPNPYASQSCIVFPFPEGTKKEEE